MTGYGSDITVGHMAVASLVGSSALFCSSKFGFCTSDIFCHHSLVHTSFKKYRSDPRVVAVARVVLEMIFVRNGLMSLLIRPRLC